MNKNYNLLRTSALLFAGIAVTSCTAGVGARSVQGPAGIANPASVHCDAVGGRAATETRPDGSEFGVCLFEDNRQCGQWALFYGDCPVGGLRVTGYPTDAARYCVLTGGRYGAAGTRETCTSREGTTCDVEAFYRGDCR